MPRNKIIAVVVGALVIIVGFKAWYYTGAGGRNSVERNTASAISLNPKDVNSYLAFTPILEKTKSRMPKIDPATGLAVEEVKPGLFFVTDGSYQSAFLKTNEGVIVFDAPQSYGAKLPGVISERIPKLAVKYLVYSHSHTDHIGGAGAFKDVQDLQVIADEKVAEELKGRKNPAILLPTVAFQDTYTLSFGGEEAEMKSLAFHSADADTVVYLPKQKFLIAIDTVTPGHAPFFRFAITADLEAYMKSFDELLKYDFDTILTGHPGILGNRADVEETKAYVLDVKAAVMKTLPSLQDRFGKTFGVMGKDANFYLVFRSVLESVRRDCSAEVIGKWKDKLSIVDLWADSHCESMFMYLYTH